MDVIFIHGLSGHPVETWSCPESTDEQGNFWPAWLAEDAYKINVYTLGYPAGMFAKFADKEMNIFERSKFVLEFLSTFDFGARPIAIIAHSLGGVLAKQLIHTGLGSSNAEWISIAESIRLVMFLATPHTGSSLAAIQKFAFPRISSDHIDILKPGNPHLDILNDYYRVKANSHPIKTIAFYEKHQTKKTALVVEHASADPGVAGCAVIPIDANHETICKPKDRYQLIYRSAVKHLTNFSKNNDKSSTANIDSPHLKDMFTTEDYDGGSIIDRRDLHQKLIDADREYEYIAGLDAQSKFARDYYRNGLSGNVRSMHDTILAEVEQRFNTHVYNISVANGGTKAEIQQAIQSHVIDPITMKYNSMTNINNATITRAIYYLAGKCYISWNVA